MALSAILLEVPLTAIPTTTDPPLVGDHFVVHEPDEVRDGEQVPINLPLVVNTSWALVNRPTAEHGPGGSEPKTGVGEFGHGLDDSEVLHRHDHGPANEAQNGQ